VVTAPSQEHPNVTRYRRMMAAFNANDLSTIAELVAPDVQYIVPGRSMLAGHTHDLSGLLEMLRRGKELSQGTLQLELRAVVADAQYLFVYGHVRAQRGEKSLDTDHCVVFRFEGDKIVEGRTVPVDLYEFDAFWS
jgi:ketosteroid isomerase-like protein